MINAKHNRALDEMTKLENLVNRLGPARDIMLAHDHIDDDVSELVTATDALRPLCKMLRILCSEAVESVKNHDLDHAIETCRHGQLLARMIANIQSRARITKR